MGQTDIVLRQLGNLFQSDLVSALLPDLKVKVVGTVPTQLALGGVERRVDHAVRTRINGVETIVHVEFQLEHSRDMPVRVLVYNGLLRHLSLQQRRPVPVRSVVVYLMHERRRPVPQGIPVLAAARLRDEAAGIQRRPEDPQVQLDYDVFCVWERRLTLQDVRRRPVLAPVAVLTPGIGEAHLPALRRALDRASLSRGRRGDLLAITYFLAARRFDEDLLQSFRRSKAMLESSTYRLVIEEGRAEGEARGEARGRASDVLKLVRHRLGRVPRGLQGKLRGMDARALERLFDRVLAAEDPQQLRALLSRLPRRS